MRETQLAPGLKAPVPVYILGGLFVLAPVFNVLMTLIYFKTPEWYFPSTWLRVIPEISFVSWLWFALLVATGIALMIPRKATWMFAIFSLVASILYNLYAFTKIGNIALMMFSLAGILSVFLVLFFFRFPYLDRRERWWGVARRLFVDAPISIEGYADRAVLRNISMTGVLILFPGGGGPSIGGEITFQLTPDLRLNAKIVRTSAEGCGALLIRLDREKSSLLKTYLASLAR